MSKNVHVFFLIGLKYYLFVILCFDTASHDTGAILFGKSWGIPPGPFRC